MLTNTILDANQTWLVTMSCERDGCSVKSEFKGERMTLLPDVARLAEIHFKGEGWRIGKAHPIKRDAVTERDEDGKPTKTEKIDSTAIGDVCPSCAKGLKVKENG